MDTMTPKASTSRSNQPQPPPVAPLPSLTRSRRNKINGIVNIPTKTGKRKESSIWTTTTPTMSMSIPVPSLSSCKKLKSMKMVSSSSPGAAAQEDPSASGSTEYILGLKFFGSGSHGHGHGYDTGSLSSNSNQSPTSTIESSEASEVSELGGFILDDLVTYDIDDNSSEGVNEYDFQNLITFDDKSSCTNHSSKSTTTDGPNLPIYFNFDKDNKGNDANNNIEKIIKNEIIPEVDDNDNDNIMKYHTIGNGFGLPNSNGEFDWLDLGFLTAEELEGSPKKKSKSTSSKKVKSKSPDFPAPSACPIISSSSIKIKKEKDTKEDKKLNNLTVSEITKRILAEDFKSSRLKLTTPGVGVKEEIIEKLDSSAEAEDVKPVITDKNSSKKNKKDNVDEKKQGKHWSNEETGEFYKSLQLVGSDFDTISSKYLTHRSRKEIKAKFKKEEKNNPQLIGSALDAKLDFQKVLDAFDDKTKLKELIKNEFCRQSKTTTANTTSSLQVQKKLRPKIVSEYSWGTAVKTRQFFESRHLSSSNDEDDADDLQIANIVPQKDKTIFGVPIKYGPRSSRSIFSINKIPSIRPKSNKISKDWAGLPDWMLINAGLEDLIGVSPKELRDRNEINIDLEEPDELEIENSTLDENSNVQDNLLAIEYPSEEIPMILPIKENGEMPSMPDLF